ncbi:hypothetical protein J6590_004291 [Homalodisca vitripennis]|nr:hypothetical protein J6590_004291 [Homalodisca vitripennis]
MIDSVLEDTAFKRLSRQKPSYLQALLPCLCLVWSVQNVKVSVSAFCDTLEVYTRMWRYHGLEAELSLSDRYEVTSLSLRCYVVL